MNMLACKLNVELTTKELFITQYGQITKHLESSYVTSRKMRNQTGTLLQTLPNMFSSPFWLALNPQLSYLVLNQNRTILTQTIKICLVRQLISGKYPTNENLWKWKLKDTPTCERCDMGKTDTIHHHILECPTHEHLRVTMF